MTDKHDEQEPKEPQTPEEAIWFLLYHSGLFFLKIAIIVVLWLFISETLRKWMF